MLKQLSLKESHIVILQKEAEVQFEKAIGSRKTELSRLKQDCENLQKKIDSIEKKYIEDSLEYTTYQKWSSGFKKEMFEKTNKVNALAGDDSALRAQYKTHLPYLTDINWLYDQADIGNKQALLRNVFLGGLSKEKESYRTAFIHPLFSDKANSIKGFSIGYKTEKSAELADFSLSTQKHTTSELFVCPTS